MIYKFYLLLIQYKLRKCFLLNTSPSFFSFPVPLLPERNRESFLPSICQPLLQKQPTSPSPIMMCHLFPLPLISHSDLISTTLLASSCFSQIALLSFRIQEYSKRKIRLPLVHLQLPLLPTPGTSSLSLCQSQRVSNMPLT